ncbi:hypothetical protein [Fibrella aquatica]|uniref:hypothetical protein n=1 Tax=Fibrella aquatica TaxID=3242487 RepID=UPI003521BCE4
MIITWKRCSTYKEACDHTGVIYLHEWDGKPFYWGKAHRSFFCGGSRKYEEGKRSGRYNAGYRHWIEGCLQHGAKLYIGKLTAEALAFIDDVENFLICTYPSPPDMNKRKRPLKIMEVSHEGDVPSFILDKYPLKSERGESKDPVLYG